MQRLEAEFEAGEVARFAVNWGETTTVIADYLSDTGISVPVLLDQVDGSESCRTLPDPDSTLTEHFQLRVGDPKFDPPFPLQVIIGPDGRFAYLSRDHRPDEVVRVLRELLGSN